MMGIEIVEGTSQKPASSSELVKLLRTNSVLSGQLFIGYPIVGTSEGPHRIDALLVSDDKGIVVIDLIEGTDAADYSQRQDDSANKVEARLKTHSELMDRRDLRISVHTISFAPGISNLAHVAESGYPIANRDTVLKEIERLTWPKRNDTVYKLSLSAIENISTIRRSRARRNVKREGSRGDRLKRLESSIATLDNSQSKAVIETVDGLQRIRGLAGSGKTIVLALKAAYLHAQHPEWRIAVTFNTRSLKGQFRRLIYNFCLEQTNQEPDWSNLRILNAWGAPGEKERDGIYYEFCRLHDIEYLDFLSVKRLRGSGNEFSKACEIAISQVTQSKPTYDVILVDEAQDFSPAFLRLCHRLLRDPKRLVYAYDELQNLSGNSLPSPEEIFDEYGRGAPLLQSAERDIEGPRHDVILKKCYRNSRPVLVTAHAIGFGIYREPPEQSETGLIQMFDNSQLWTEVGYQVKDGELRDDRHVTLQRNTETSPEFLESHSAKEDLIRFICFNTEEEQALWIANAIKKNLEEDELRCDDIVVINPDPLTTRSSVGPVRRILFDLGINSHLAGVDTDPDVFFGEEESVTFTGVFVPRATRQGWYISSTLRTVSRGGGI